MTASRDITKVCMARRPYQRGASCEPGSTGELGMSAAPRARSVASIGALLVLFGGCTTRLTGDQLLYDSGVFIADADESERPGDGGVEDADAAVGLDAPTDAAPATIPTWDDDVLPLFRLYCLNCHGPVPAAGATMSFDTYARVTADLTSGRTGQTDYAYVLIKDAVTSMLAPMPPAFAMTPLMPRDVDLIRIWAEVGAPEDADDADGGTSPPDSRVADVGPAAPDAEPDGGVAPPDGTVFADAEIFPDALVFPDAEVFPDAALVRNPLLGVGAVTQVQDQFSFLEGPLWIPGPDVLLFSDVIAGRIHRLTPPNAVDVFRDPSDIANGLALDPIGRLLMAEHESRSVTRMATSGGAVTVLATTYQGLRFNSPNDVTSRSDGIIYFSDPPYGLGARPREIPFNGLFRMVLTGTVATVTAEWEGDVATRPNGVVLSNDERTLFMADTANDAIMAFDVAPISGGLSNPRVFVQTANEPDGMAIDLDGNLLVSTGSGVQAFSPTGQLWGLLPVPRVPANIAWGDADRQTLYITATSVLYRVRMAIPGGRD